MVAAPVAHLGQGMLGVHMDIREVADGNGIEHGAKGVLDVVALKIGLDLEQETGLHGHAAAPEPIAVEVIEGVAVLVGEIEIVFVILQNPFRLGANGGPGRR